MRTFFSLNCIWESQSTRTPRDCSPFIRFLNWSRCGRCAYDSTFWSGEFFFVRYPPLDLKKTCACLPGSTPLSASLSVFLLTPFSLKDFHALQAYAPFFKELKCYLFTKRRWRLVESLRICPPMSCSIVNDSLRSSQQLFLSAHCTFCHFGPTPCLALEGRFLSYLVQ